MATVDGSIYQALIARGVSRRSFLKFSAAMAGALMLPAAYGPRIASALSTTKRLPVIWLEGQDCAGNTEAFLRASHPTVAEIVLDTLSVDYHGPRSSAGSRPSWAASPACGSSTTWSCG
jgi:hydrogenase small subunit